MHINLNELHIWVVDLNFPIEQKAQYLDSLSAEEKLRAQAFKIANPQENFIATRYTLRNILSQYLNSTNIKIAFTEHKKPYLLDHPELQFNLSHSNELALIALALQHPVGVDIEKIRATFNPAIVTRYFNENEQSALAKFPAQEQIKIFHRVWAKKEAIIKAIGGGLTMPVSSFSVSTEMQAEIIAIEKENWHLFPLEIHPNYEAAVATNESIHQILHWQLNGNEIKLDKVFKF